MGPLSLVTGGAGFIGSHLVEALTARGERVRVFDNFSTGLRSNLETIRPAPEIIEADLANAGALEKVTAGVSTVSLTDTRLTPARWHHWSNVVPPHP